MTTKGKVIEALRKAVCEEIEEIKKKGGGAQIVGRNVKFISEKADIFIYQTTIENPAELPDDTPIQVKTNTESVQGHIINIDGLILTIGLESYLGKELVRIIIVANPYYLLKILDERLGESKSDYKLALKAFGYSSPIISEDTEFTSSINLETHQNKAVAKALGSDVSYIWGPPGTGKTYVLSAISEELFSRNKSVLIVSHTNIAIDNALERLAKTLEDNEDYNNGRVIRYGTPHIKDLFDKHPQLDINHWIDVKGKELSQERQKLEEELKKYQEKDKKLSKQVEVIDKLQKNIQLHETVKERVQKYKTLEQEIVNKKKIFERNLKSTTDLIKEYPNLNTFKRIIRGININSLRTKQENIRVNLKEIQTELNKLHTQQEGEEEKLAKTQKLIDRKKEILKSYKIDQKDYDEIKAKIDEISLKISSAQKRIAEINEKLNNIGSEILAQAKIIGTTLTKGYLKNEVYQRDFDAVIVDEASMAALPVLFFNLGLSKGKAIIIGDFRQLSPIARGKTDLIEKWLKRDIYELADIVRNINEERHDNRVTQLTVQHRMHPDISKIINEHIYDNKLSDAKKGSKEKKKEVVTIRTKPFSNHAVTFVDTSAYDPWCATLPSWSRLNLYTAELAYFLALQALNEGVEDIGIIAPFRAQTNIINKILLETNEKESEKFIKVSSIHTTQGRERELIILDLTESTGSWPSKLFKGSNSSEAMRLINVAISRARSKLVIIGNLKYIDSKYPHDSILKNIINDVVQKHPVVTSNEIFDFAPDSSGIMEKPIIVDEDNYNKRLSLYTQANFYPAFFQDLSKCKKELIIFSAFIYKNRYSDLDPALRDLVNSGVSVVIYTSKPKSNEREKKEIIKHLTGLGIKVIIRSNMHEKIALIDREISWHGTLNILSHQNTTESMMRFFGNKMASELFKQFKIDASISDYALDKKIQTIRYGSCPHCKQQLIVKNGKNGLFLSCPNYPKCKFAADPDNNVIKMVYGEDYLICEKCGEEMMIKRSRRGRKFLGCPNYPDHSFTRSI